MNRLLGTLLLTILTVSVFCQKENQTYYEQDFKTFWKNPALNNKGIERLIYDDKLCAVARFQRH